ncbi:DUF397 domain-containing protein [Embleya scabrispora]|nr:DUF397 domain-containing protein [Embleya scabrispora]
MEVATSQDAVPVRDSKDPSLGHLVVPAASWGALTAALRD